LRAPTADEKQPLLVALTGRDREADRRRSEAAGIEVHLAKPVDAGHLRWLLRRFQSVIE
jgi:CheY-like chemotaxis protein